MAKEPKWTVSPDTGDPLPPVPGDGYLIPPEDTGDHIERLRDPRGRNRGVYISGFDPPMRPGKPIQKDWVDALTRLVADVAESGALPEKQADIEGWLRRWFIYHDLYVSDSIIRERARAIVQERTRARDGDNTGLTQFLRGLGGTQL